MARKGIKTEYLWPFVVVGFVMMLILALYHLASMQRSRTWVPTRVPGGFNLEKFGGDGIYSEPEYSLIYFYMDRCPHCKKFQPEWEKCKSYVSKTKFYETKVRLHEFSASEHSKSKEYKVDGYPTVILEHTKSGKRVVYEGARTKDGIVDFLTQNIS
jgi:hypothetical protein